MHYRTLFSTLALALGLSIAPAHAERVLNVGTDATFAPFESLNQSKEIVGFDADLIKAIAQKSGLKIKLVNTPWEGLFAGLNTGDRDIVIAAVTITPERKASMDFSEPYFEAKQLIIVRDGSKVTKLADLKGKKVGVQTGTTGDTVAQKAFGKTSPDIRRYENIVLALTELRAGGIEAVVADNGVVNNYLTNNKNTQLKTIDDSSFAKEYYGIAVKKGNKALLDQINKGLATSKADGSYQKIYQQYFGR
ncbi:basic amino acid ABC transporter substrate-binding protein [Chitinibacter bivalviorum]|uniref:Basic amino acid ABC transporter substrate-binding protein n=1 Tax=Chitinibacter bivalviorum TaxID=2739434 RepID=A0A7H9BEW2_9NEIS|nr:basic amino acid ABC transporter substrate-binding protein [Chitinibacter bivalviorum]QLG86766.1 basic amino acid ABC transporter substrate-binding protein [Chitinibacter bivalviorum]